ncbi:ABC transporter ATP-binding protein [Sanguibacter antarcticus]|uniref:ABC-2 type transport system ATP-binding protein n=1 Tax=Sanguibacter antarcticus TaxID=372484 RepID=A0A2A9E3I4_9MICO|nr:ABC transporter ATP-binding protein [Sanguibacter antarcticus]PFG33394.1 ABC-2 type transport system ATP-binding protein [Sanguibacter antarcticus]
MPPTAPAVEIVGLVKRYDDHEIVRSLDLVAARGQVTAVLGPNGAGKTTTIECCEGLRRPDGGTVRVLGLDPLTDGPSLRPRVGVMLQDGGLPSSVRALELLEHVSTMYADPWDVPDLVERLGLAGFARTTVRRLSGGQRQRLAMATALVGRPELVFLDEPSAGLDPQSRHAVWELVRALRAQGVSVLLTTHLMDEAEDLADHVVIVDHGQVIAQGSPSELIDSSARTSLTFAAAPGLPTISLASALGAGVQETTPGHYTVSGSVVPATLATLTRWCADRDVLLSRLSTGRRTLEDVFLDLTGRSLR